MTFELSQRSKQNLNGVNDDLIRIVYRALQLSTIDFGIIEGIRSLEHQKRLFAAGKSQTLNSRHLTGHAVDVFAYPTPAGSWDWKYYKLISDAFKLAGRELNIPVEWGGDWKTLKDGPHFQLPYADYPG